MRENQRYAVGVLVVVLAVFGPMSMLTAQEEEILTQGKHATELVKALGIDYLLPEQAMEQDSANLLASLGIFPCNHKWEIDKELTDEDYCCIIGEEPGCDVFLSADELRRKLFERFPELFWVGTEPRQPVSPFAP